MSHVDDFFPATREWFRSAFPGPTPVQERGWSAIASGQHTLMLAPTGSGKTLAAFLACLDRLSHELPEEGDEERARGTSVLYVSPLKALVYDVERNLRAPLAGIQRAAEGLGTPVRPLRVAIRTGDTSARDRRAYQRDPADVLVTTPESLYLILSSQAKAALRSVRWVIVDEIHAVAASKRGVHLALSLERLSHLVTRAAEDAAEGPTESARPEPQRIGLSATQRPLDEVARFLGGDREVTIVDASAPPRMDLALIVPVLNMEAPFRDADDEPEEEPEPPDIEGALVRPPRPARPPQPTPTRHGIWDAIHPRLLAEVRAHRSTLIFVNSRLLCERLAQRLNELAEEELVKAHHGSLAHGQRAEIEEELKRGELRGLVATSSLELGIDMGAIDLVILVESPGAVSRGLQRVGRAGHSVGEVSKARIYPKFRGDLLEAAVCARGMSAGEIEHLRVPRRCLDVLAQHVASMVSQRDWKVADLETLVRRAYSYRELPVEALRGVLDMLSGRYPSDAFSDLRPLLVWDRDHDVLRARRGTRSTVVLNAGTIPDRGTYAVHLGEGGPRIGELDEEMVFESRRGETFVLGATTWRIAEITRDRVIVQPAPGEPGKLPFWHGAGPGRPVELGRALGAFVRELAEQPPARARGWLEDLLPVQEHAAENLVRYVHEQLAATRVVPSDRTIVIERFRDELGDWKLCVLSPFGGRIHAGWALAIEAQLSRVAGFNVQTIWSDDGIVLRLADTEAIDDLPSLIPSSEAVEDLIVEQLAHSALFAATFREAAARALLLPRRGYQKRRPLWAQRIKAETLLAAAGQFPDFPIVLETYRECLKDVFDLPSLREILRDVEARRIEVVEVETDRASPFAQSLTWAYVSAFMYQTDAPLAERRAQALTLDRDLLSELLGHDELRELLDADVIAELEDELQGRAEGRQARHPDGVSDLLRRVGDLSPRELEARCTEAPEAWLRELEDQRRALRLRIAGEARWVAIEDTARFRDGLGCAPPGGLPAVFLEPVEGALEGLVLRYARTRGPFTTGELSARFDVRTLALEPILSGLERRGRLLRGALRPGGVGEEWCCPEVLRTIRRRTLARLRREVEPVEGACLARFLVRWQLGASSLSAASDVEVSEPEPDAEPLPNLTGGRTLQRLREAVAQLEGLPLPFSTLEERILPARVPGFRPQHLDQLGQLGEVVWVGCSSLGAKDGRLALYTRARVPLLLDRTSTTDPSAGPFAAERSDTERPASELHLRLLAHLETRGASFAFELQQVGGADAATTQRALLDLAWSGWITNDGFQVLRAARARSSKSRRARVASTAVGGRWVAVGSLLGMGEPPSPRERARARANTLLDRYGVIARAVVNAEGQGAFGTVYPALRTLEELGRARRGHFVAGLEGAQFAAPGAVDRLRAVRSADALEPVLLAATDPANPYGVSLPWPATAREAGRPRRSAKALVALVAGAPVFVLEPGSGALITFPAATQGRLLDAALELLREESRRSRRDLNLERIDGVAARNAALAPSFQRAGFVPDYRGLSLTTLNSR